jgi:glycosyltransferase involved in cell wall biosynthesis
VKVLIFHQYFGTSQDAGAGVRTYELGRRLVRKGDCVTIVAGDSIRFSGRNAHIRLLWTHEWIDGIKVIRVRIPFGASNSILPRIIGFCWFIPIGFLAALCVQRPDVVVASSTPLTIGIPGYLLSRLKRVPFVLELRDLWPDCVVDWNVVSSKLLVRAAYWLESFLYQRAAQVIAVTDGIRLQLELKGVNPATIAVVTNATDIDLFVPHGAQADLGPTVPEGAFVCIYSGSLGYANYVDLLLDVAAELRGSSIHFVIIGAGSQKYRLQSAAKKRQLQTVHFADPVPRTKVPAYLRSAHVGIASFRPGALTKIFLPNKFFDYLACGLPVIVNFDGEARSYLEESGSGVYVPPSDFVACAEAIRKLAGCPEKLKQMRLRARNLAEARFSWDQKAVEFRGALLSIFRHSSSLSPRTSS